MKYEYLFKPYQFGSVTVKNRFIMASMSSDMCDDDEGFVSQRHLNYYEGRAEGGFGIVTVELAAVNRLGVAHGKLLYIDDDKYIPGYAKLTERIHKHGATAVLQLFHAGRQTHAVFNSGRPVAPSAIPCPMSREIPRELSVEDIYDLIKDYADGAVRAKAAGFDGVQVHCGHGYLLDEFLSPRVNKRTDEFGGNTRGRSRVVERIIKAIKEACGSDFPVSVRMTSVDGHYGGTERNLALTYIKLMEEYGADMIDITAGSYGCQGLIMPPPDVELSFNLDFAKKVRSSVSIPVAFVGRNLEPVLMELAVKDGYTDCISLGRQSICDPELPRKLEEGREDEILQCMNCTIRCFASRGTERFTSIGDVGMSCVINPLSANRPEMPILPAETKKSVMVIGSGPAGLEAAWIAAKRGHAVSLYEKAPRSRAGGQFYYASIPPYKQSISTAIYHYIKECEKYGVDMHFDTEVTERMIREIGPDVLLIATGATPVIPPFKGDISIPVYNSLDVLDGKTGDEAIKGKVLLIGGGQVALEAAEFCLDYVDKITVVEMMDRLGSNTTSNIYLPAFNNLLSRFKESGKVDINVSTKVLRYTKTGVVCERNGEEVLFDGYDAVIVSVGSRAYQPFANADTLAKEVYTIGDVNKPRSASEAFFEGAKIAARI